MKPLGVTAWLILKNFVNMQGVLIQQTLASFRNAGEKAI
jgi:hypothetical protein